VISDLHSGIALVLDRWRAIQAFEPNSNALRGRFLALQPVKRFAVVGLVEIDELLKRTAEYACSAVADIKKSHQAGKHCTDPVHDEIAHRIHKARVSALIEASRFANVVACYAQVLRFHLFDIGKRFRDFTNQEAGTSGS
jgi:hypothetical protein